MRRTGGNPWALEGKYVQFLFFLQLVFCCMFSAPGHALSVGTLLTHFHPPRFNCKKAPFVVFHSTDRSGVTDKARDIGDYYLKANVACFQTSRTRDTDRRHSYAKDTTKEKLS
ncbi:hypothetical protein BDV26DRAFT_269380 [Aspergillus bertholletiae]|uniref:Uncharacterized protein n=1 Tax=Aspergillus bertholletiae TaxID=1226010 RepID=A0A5N7B0V2_9EURO|nr:hypothetical protein BDV26DRAFT_269380 [Aspergillus bertholletiae]